jgi:hypothetical protein
MLANRQFDTVRQAVDYVLMQYYEPNKLSPGYKRGDVYKPGSIETVWPYVGNNQLTRVRLGTEQAAKLPRSYGPTGVSTPAPRPKPGQDVYEATAPDKTKVYRFVSHDAKGDPREKIRWVSVSKDSNGKYKANSYDWVSTKREADKTAGKTIKARLTWKGDYLPAASKALRAEPTVRQPDKRKTPPRAPEAKPPKAKAKPKRTGYVVERCVTKKTEHSTLVAARKAAQGTTSWIRDLARGVFTSKTEAGAARAKAKRLAKRKGA